MFQDLTLNAMYSVNVAQLQIYFDDGVRRIGKNYNAFPVWE